MASNEQCIAFQGVAGAYSDLACRTVFPSWQTRACDSFEDAFAAVRDGLASLAMIPVENSLAGRVADVHHLLPETGLHIIAEHFQRVEHQLLAPPGATLATLKTVHSHVQALSQCRRAIASLNLRPAIEADTAGAARLVAERGDVAQAAIASALAGRIYGLQTLRAGIEDEPHNTTRFLVLAAAPRDPGPDSGPTITTFLFTVRSVPAALYKALGGFATNGVNLTRLESYLFGGGFAAAQFWADIEGHPSERRVELAFEELRFFSEEVRVLGIYPSHPFRRNQRNGPPA